MAGSAALLVLLVDPEKRRQGIGSTLLGATESALRKQGVTHLGLGFAGGGDYFWQGIPVESGAWPFFAGHGWSENERSSDLVLGLEDYKSPQWVGERSVQAKINIHAADLYQYEAVRRFERSQFPVWATFYEGFAGYRDGNILVAEDASGTIVGSALLSSVVSVPWKQSLGERCGSLGVLGVAKHAEGQGIGLALAARGAELLKERGCSACHIGWTGLVAWYGKLGAKPWAEYHMSSKPLDATIPRNEHSADILDLHPISC